METKSIQAIVNSKRLPVLFIGSGLTRRYIKNAPNWDELLQECFKIVDPSGITFAQIQDKCRQDKLSQFETYQVLGTEIESIYNKYFFEKLKGKQNPILPKWVSKKVSPLKMHLRNRFKKLILKDKEYLKKEIKLVNDLNNKVASIITTNFDLFIENFLFTEGYDVFHKQSDLFKSDRYNVAEIYKIHGSIEDVNSIVFTKSDYENFKQNRRLIIAKMLTLFSDSPIIFLGYSLNDENVKSIILDFLECIDPEEVSKLEDHFIFVEYKKGELELVETRENISTNRGNIPITKISTDNFTKLFSELNKITPGLPASIVKTTHRLIKKIITSSLETGKIDSIVINEDQLSTVSNENLAIAFGEKQTILGKYGYSTFDIVNLFEDVLFGNFDYIPHLIVTSRLRSVARTQLVPVFKYYEQLTDQEKAANTYFDKFLIRNSFETIYSRKFVRECERIEKFKTVSDLIEYLKENGIDKIDAIFKIFSANIKNFSIADIRIFCCTYFEQNKNDCLMSTYFRRAVMYLDVIEYKKT